VGAGPCRSPRAMISAGPVPAYREEDAERQHKPPEHHVMRAQRGEGHLSEIEGAAPEDACRDERGVTEPRGRTAAQEAVPSALAWAESFVMDLRMIIPVG